MESPDRMDLVEVGVGFDPFHAQVIADHCADEGIRGEVVLFDETRYELGSAGRIPNRFICAAADEQAVRQIIDDLYPNLGFEPDTSSPPLATSLSRPRNRVIGALLGFIFIGPLLYAGFQMLRDALGL